MDENEFYRQLVQNYADNRLTAEELEVFFYCLEKGGLDPYLVAAMNEAGGISETDATTKPGAVVEELAAETATVPLPASIPRKHHIGRWTRIAAAAVLIFAIAGGVWLWLNLRQSTGVNRAGETAQKIIPPGGE